MPEHLCITVRFFDGTFHGRADRGEPEWPPSPLRLFQSLVAAAASVPRHELGGLRTASPALRWLETQEPPAIIAPPGRPGEKYRTYVPDNVGDLLAGRWTRGDDGIIKRSEKDVPAHTSPGGRYRRALRMAPVRRSMGWKKPGRLGRLAGGDFLRRRHPSRTWGGVLIWWRLMRRWFRRKNSARCPDEGGVPRGAVVTDTSFLRVPVVGTLADLERRHAAFLARTARGRFDPVPPI